MKKCLEMMRNPSKNLSGSGKYAGQGKQSVKQLVKQGAGVSDIDIGNGGLHSFENIARKHGIDFAVKKDSSIVPPRFKVFFKSKDASAMTAAFTEFTAKQLKMASKPSVIRNLDAMMQMVKNQVLDITKKVSRGLGL